MFIRRCIDCQKIIHTHNSSREVKCYSCGIKKTDKQLEEEKEMRRKDFKCPACSHEWMEYPPLEPLDESEY